MNLTVASVTPLALVPSSVQPALREQQAARRPAAFAADAPAGYARRYVHMPWSDKLVPPGRLLILLASFALLAMSCHDGSDGPALNSPPSTQGGPALATPGTSSTQETTVPAASPAYDTPPELVRRVDPKPPSGDFAPGGMIIVEAHISSTGKVERVTLLHRFHPTWDAAVLKAVHQWQYKPARTAGHPVSSWATIRFDVDPR